MDVTDVAHQFSDPPRSLLLLPDTPIPELDEPLVNALQEQNYPLRSSLTDMHPTRSSSAYQPTILNGNLVEVDTTITVDFRLCGAKSSTDHHTALENVAGDSRILRLMVDCTYNIGHILSL